MKRIWCFLLLMLLIAPSSFAINWKDYYIKDKATYNGIRLVDLGIVENCRFCHEKTDGEMKKYPPTEVSEYNIDGKKLFVAMDILLDGAHQRVFLEKRVFGDYAQYHYMDQKNDLFFLQKGNDPMMELPKNAHSEMFNMEKLAEYTKECPEVADKGRQVRFSSTDLSFFLEQVNDCRLKPFPPLRLGVNTSLNLTKLQPFAGHTGPDYLIFNYKYEMGPSLGFFLDQPILQFGLSVHAAVNYSYTFVSYHKRIDWENPNYESSTDYTLFTTLHTLELPVHLRYTLPLSNLRPYLEVGGFIDWNFKNVSYVDRILNKNGTRLDFGSVYNQLLDNLNVGPSIGIGVEYPLNGRHQVFLECHYTSRQGLTNPELSTLSRFALTAGYYF